MLEYPKYMVSPHIRVDIIDVNKSFIYSILFTSMIDIRHMFMRLLNHKYISDRIIYYLYRARETFFSSSRIIYMPF